MTTPAQNNKSDRGQEKSTIKASEYVKLSEHAVTQIDRMWTLFTWFISAVMVLGSLVVGIFYFVFGGNQREVKESLTKWNEGQIRDISNSVTRLTQSQLALPAYSNVVKEATLSRVAEIPLRLSAMTCSGFLKRR